LALLRALRSRSLLPLPLPLSSLLVPAYFSILQLVPRARTKTPGQRYLRRPYHDLNGRIPTHLTKHDAALPKNLLLIIIIDAVPRPEDLVLIAGECALERLLHLSRPHVTPQPHGPEGGVVEIVDVAVYLAPGKVVAEVTERRVTDCAGVEGGEVRWLERGQTMGRPKVHVEGGEGGEDS
jgi:hypothetical protein